MTSDLDIPALKESIRHLIEVHPDTEDFLRFLREKGKKVALVDADLRRPMVHKLLGLPNRDGLSTLFRGHEGIHTVFRSKLEMPHLMVITSGSLPPNPAELLGSGRMEQILEELRTIVDVVVIDTPPSLVADAQILSAKVDAVLLVVQPGRTHAETARACLDLFKHAGARVMVGLRSDRSPGSMNPWAAGSPHGNADGTVRGSEDRVSLGRDRSLFQAAVRPRTAR